MHKTAPVASTIKWTGVTIDCQELEPVVRFYEELLGFDIVPVNRPDWAQLRDPLGSVHLNVQADPAYEPPTWPEQHGRPGKMLHFEVVVDDLEEAVTIATAAGGRPAPWQPPDRDASRIRVVLDPAGHPLCLFVHGE